MVEITEVDAMMYSCFGTPPPSPPSMADSGDIHESASEVDEVSKDAEQESYSQMAFEEMLVRGPEVGMVFLTIEDLLAAYQEFGRSQGFSVAIRNSRDDKYCMIACDRGRTGKVLAYTKRINCEARINAKCNADGRWMISKVALGHNHELDPSMSSFMSGHRHMTTSMKIQLETNDMAGLSVCKNVRLLEAKNGGPQNLSVNARDCRNFIDERRRLRLGVGDADAIRNLFVRLQKKDSSFFHLMDINDKGQLRNVMWIHPRSRAAYEDFHDVVSFDTTYLVNKYNMPFATVVGVNHHHQSILLGCALLTHEHAESFKWFFSNWLEAMGGVHPRAILTDQCESITIAIRELMPGTVHRFCIWHILSKVPMKFKNVSCADEAKGYFNRIVYGSMTTAEFEERWLEFVRKYRLENHTWLQSLWKEKEKWAPVYLRGIFWAGMRSTQRSESMHAYFDSYITSRSTLKTFVEQYEIAICDKIHKEMMQDYKSKCVHKVSISPFPWENQVAKLYTSAVMELFQRQIKNVWHCNVFELNAPDQYPFPRITKYKVRERLPSHPYRFPKECDFIVEYRSNGDYYACECKMFETNGILCCHILKVMADNGICRIHDRYILRRWRKDVYRPHASIRYSGAYPHMSDQYKMFQEAERVFQECIDLGYLNTERMKLIKDRLGQMRDDLSKLPPVSVSSTSNGEEACDDQHVLDPEVVRQRGRPRSNRYKSGMELGSNKRARNTNSEGRGASQHRRGGGRNSISRGRGRNSNAHSLGSNSLTQDSLIF